MMGVAESVVLLVLAIGVVILIHLCFTKRVIRRSFANGPMMAEGNGTWNATSASRRIDLEKLPSFDFREKKVACSPMSCAICLSNFRGGHKCRLLPICKLSFHMEYADEWLLTKAYCQICRGSSNSIEMVENTVGLDGHQNDRRSPES